MLLGYPEKNSAARPPSMRRVRGPASSLAGQDEDPRLHPYNTPVFLVAGCAGWFSLNVPSGLTLYWFVNNMLSTGQQLYLKATVKVGQCECFARVGTVGLRKADRADVHQDSSLHWAGTERTSCARGPTMSLIGADPAARC